MHVLLALQLTRNLKGSTTRTYKAAALCTEQIMYNASLLLQRSIVQQPAATATNATKYSLNKEGHLGAAAHAPWFPS